MAGYWMAYLTGHFIYWPGSCIRAARFFFFSFSSKGLVYWVCKKVQNELRVVNFYCSGIRTPLTLLHAAGIISFCTKCALLLDLLWFFLELGHASPDCRLSLYLELQPTFVRFSKRTKNRSRSSLWLQLLLLLSVPNSTQLIIKSPSLFSFIFTIIVSSHHHQSSRRLGCSSFRTWLCVSLPNSIWWLIWLRTYFLSYFVKDSSALVQSLVSAPARINLL